MVFKIIKELKTGDIMLGEAGGKVEIYSLEEGTLIPGLFTVETEIGTLIADGDDEIETQ